MGNPDIALNLDTDEHSVLVSGGGAPHYSPTGHIIYGVGGTLRAVAFDSDRLVVTDPNPVPVLDGVVTKANGAANYDVASDGSLAYVAGTEARENPRGSLIFVDRQGVIDEVLQPDSYVYPRFSPDGTRIAVQINAEDGSNIFIYETLSDRLRQLTFDGGKVPLWTPDGTQVTFLANDALWNIASDFTEPPDLLSQASERFGIAGPYSWSPNGDVLLWYGMGGVRRRQ